jgi:hypothetical protein
VGFKRYFKIIIVKQFIIKQKRLLIKLVFMKG